MFFFKVFADMLLKMLNLVPILFRIDRREIDMVLFGLARTISSVLGFVISVKRGYGL